jgi:hypothetical protein
MATSTPVQQTIFVVVSNRMQADTSFQPANICPSLFDHMSRLKTKRQIVDRGPPHASMIGRKRCAIMFSDGTFIWRGRAASNRRSQVSSQALSAPPSVRRAREIWIDQAHCRKTRGGSPALGERSEDAIHPLALQHAIDMQANGITRIVHLSLRGYGNNGRCERHDRKDQLDHENLQQEHKVHRIGCISSANFR